MQTEISRFDLVNQVCQAARSDPSDNWEKMREQRITQAKTELNRIEGRLSRKRGDFSKPKDEEKTDRRFKTLYAWGDSPKH